MDIFFMTLSQMLTMFIYIVLGYLLRKIGILPEDSDLTMSRLETYFFVPCLNLYSWMTNCTVNTLKENIMLILCGMVLVLCAVALAYPLSKVFVRKADTEELIYQRNIYKYAMTFGNYGFMGNFIVLSIWGNEMFFKYSVFTFFVTLVCCSWGVFILIPKEQGEKHSLKSFLKRILVPPIIALFVGMILGLLNLKRYVPDFMINVMSGASDCMGPVAMLLAGFVIGGYDLKKLVTDRKIYTASLMRLVVIPALFMLLMKGFGISDEIMILALITFATPFGLNTIVYPAAYGGDVKTGASMSVVSHAMAVVTIPLMYLLFIVLL